MSNPIYPCLWFDNQAKEAAEYYCSVFDNSKMLSENPIVVQFEIAGKKILGLNGGPLFKINPSISLFITCDTDEEIESIWKKLCDGGKIMMALDKYPWSEKYGWVADKFGMTWQIMKSYAPGSGQTIIPSFLFVGEQYGKAQEAVKYYTSVFPDSKINSMHLYLPGEEQPEGNLKFGHFTLRGEMFSAMDGSGDHNYNFNEGVSLVVECDDQKEIDYFWDKFISEGEESQCGWLKDKFGVSWQIIPAMLGSLLNDPVKAGKVTDAFMKMKKLDIETLVKAANS